MSEKKTRSPRGPYRTYGIDKLKICIRRILNGEIDCKQGSKEYGIPFKTVSTHKTLAEATLTKQPDGTYGEITTVKEYLGRDPTLPREVESMIKLFLENCQLIGVPRSRGKCARDILQMIIENHIKVPTEYYYILLGNDYFKRFVKNPDSTRVRFFTSKQVNEYMDRPVNVDTWMRQVKAYIKSVDDEMLRGKRIVFAIETKNFMTYTNPSRYITILLIYDGQGEIITWILVTDGSVLTYDILDQYEIDAMLLRSEDGTLNATVLKNAMIRIRRHIDYNGLQLATPAIVYMDRFSAVNFDMNVWIYCCNNCLVPCAIPRSVCLGVSALNLGPLSRYENQMLFLLHNRFLALNLQVSEMNFIHIHKAVARQSVSRTSLTRSINMMKLNAVVAKGRNDTANDQNDIDNGEDSDGRSCTSISTVSTDTTSASSTPDASSLPKPSTSARSVPCRPRAAVKRSKKSEQQNPRRLSKSTPPKVLPVAQMPEEPDVIMRANRDVHTQTDAVRIEELSEDEEEFDQNHMDATRKLLTIQEIRVEDFDSEYPESECESVTDNSNNSRDADDESSSVS